MNRAFTTKNDLAYNNPLESGLIVKTSEKLNDYKLTRSNRLKKDTRKTNMNSE